MNEHKGWNVVKVIEKLETLEIVCEEIGEDSLSHDIYEAIESWKERHNIRDD